MPEDISKTNYNKKKTPTDDTNAADIRSIESERKLLHIKREKKIPLWYVSFKEVFHYRKHEKHILVSNIHEEEGAN